MSDFIRGQGLSHPHLRAPREKNQHYRDDVLFGKDSGNQQQQQQRNHEQVTRNRARKRARIIDGGGKTKKSRSDGDDDGDNVRSEFNRVETLTFKKLHVGALLMGRVSVVRDVDLTISLPHGLRGFVSLREVSDVMGDMVDAYLADDTADDDSLPQVSDLYKCGDIVKCVVLKLEVVKGAQRVELSMRPSLINTQLSLDCVNGGANVWASVKSVEDKGYMMDIGLGRSDMMGFLSFDDSGERLLVGRSLECAVTSVSGRMIQLSSDLRALRKRSVRASRVTLTFDQLKPGMLLKCKVQKVVENGVQVQFMGVFNGTIDRDHLHVTITQETVIDELYKVGDKLKARVLYVNPTTKRIGLTMKEDLMSLERVNDDIAIGHIFDSATVVRVDEGVGLLLQVSVSSARDSAISNTIDKDAFLAYAHISNVADVKIKRLAEAYAAGTSHACRVVGFSRLDGFVTVSLKESVLQQVFMRYEDIQVGQEVDGRVVLVKDAVGVVVELAPRITALCPLMQLADVRIKSPSRRFRLDKHVKARVLSVDATNRKCIVTLKKSLVESQLQPLTSFDMAQVGNAVDGYVTGVKHYGVVVHFYNNVHGLVTNQELQKAGVEDVTSAYHNGQPLRCYIKSYDREKRRLWLSLNERQQPSQLCSAEIGSIVTGVVCDHTREPYARMYRHVCGKLERALMVRVNAGESDDDETTSSSYACIDSSQLTDYPQLCEDLYTKYLQEAQQSDNGLGSTSLSLLVLNRDAANRVFVSCKKTFLDAVNDSNSRSMPSTFDNVEEGMKLQGYVRNITDKCVFVGFLGSLVAVAPKHLLADQVVADPTALFVQGQSCNALVVSVNREQSRFIVSLRPSDLSRVRVSRLSNVKSGSVLNATVHEVLKHELCVVLTLDGHSKDMCSARLHIANLVDDASLAKDKFDEYTNRIGDSVQVKVLDVLTVSSIDEDATVRFMVNVTTRESDFASTKVRRTLKPYALVKKTQYDAFVKSVSDAKSCIWVTLGPRVSGRIASSYVSRDPNVQHNLSSHFQVGQHVKVMATKVDRENREVSLSMIEKRGGGAGVEVDQVLSTRVARIVPEHGVTVELPRSMFGFVHVTRLRDDWPDNVLSSFHKGDELKCRVLDVTKQKNGKFSVQLTARPSRVNGSSNSESSDEQDDFRLCEFADLKQNCRVRGIVKKTTSKGCFVWLSEKIVGRIMLRDLSDKYVKDTQLSFPPGKVVSGKVLTVDVDSKRVDVSLKTSNREQTTKKRKLNPEVKKNAADSAVANNETDNDSSDNDDDSDDDGDDNADVIMASDDEDDNDIVMFDATNVPELEVDDEEEAMSVDDESDDESHINGSSSSSSSDDDDDDDSNHGRKPSQKSRAAKRQKRIREEKRLVRKEMELLEADRQPQTPSDFDRLLLETPSSSILWVHYMAYFIRLTEIDQARQVAERALKTIPIDEEQEKWNVWVALLNLENMYGTQSTLKVAFERALTYNNPKHIYLEMAKIFQNSKKFSDAKETMKVALKKFGESAKVWIYKGLLCFACGEANMVHDVLKQACKRLPKRKHVKVITQFGRMEYKHVGSGGSVERGRTIFEGVVVSYPKRTDVWSVYVDLEISLAKYLKEHQRTLSVAYKALDSTSVHENIRRIFERVTHLNISVKKVQSFFKRYLQFEKDYGTPATVSHVKDSAHQYVQSKLQQ